MMKIPTSVRDTHANQRAIYEQLKERVDDVIQGMKEDNWHYLSRVKDVESFALKAETGRYDNLRALDDFFACTLVVENLEAMKKAEKLITKKFKLHERRPPKDDFTSKPSDSFRFDDTRIYVKWKDNPIARPTGLDGLLFEVQIKTFLAHGWSLATHDLIYKTDEKSWPKERIAFQVKAMLEHAETSIHEAQKLARSKSLRKTDEISNRISAIIRLLNRSWPQGALPNDMKRLAENVNRLIRKIGVDIESLGRIIDQENSLGRGANTLNLSPYTCIVQSLFIREGDKMARYLTGREERGKFRIFIPKELELPVPLQSIQLRNAVLYAAQVG
jgi:hypothetical protein